MTPEQRIAELEQQLRDTNRLAAEQKKRDKARILELDTCYSTMLAQRNGAMAKLSVAERELSKCRGMLTQEIETSKAYAATIFELESANKRSWFQRLTDALREVMA